VETRAPRNNDVGRPAPMLQAYTVLLGTTVVSLLRLRLSAVAYAQRPDATLLSPLVRGTR
jgi:hypothetical protein